jgi:hypothetical protein
MPRHAIYVLVFLVLTAEIQGEIYDRRWETPYTDFGTWFFTPSALKLPIYDFCVLLVLVWALASSPPKNAKPMVTAMWASLGFVAFEWLWGIGTGGSVQQTMWQLHPFLVMLALAGAMMTALKKPEHFWTLGKIVLASAFVRVGQLFLFYFLVVKVKMTEAPATMTTHADSALFVTAILIPLVWLLERRSLRAFVAALVPWALFSFAIVKNNRRLAWVSLIETLIVIYFMLPRSRIKRRVTVFAIAISPLLVSYVATGADRYETIFKPAHSFATMITTEDDSSKQRNIENYNLIETLKANPVIGQGWGHEYREVSVAISIKEYFEQYRFIPHNSVLGLLAFTGLVGFAGTWAFLPVAAFLLARSHRSAHDLRVRTIALVALCEIVVFMNQMYGDMGFSSLTVTTLMAMSIAAASRASLGTGAWPTSRQA